MKKAVCLFLAMMFLSLSLLVGCDGSASSAPETLEGTTWEFTQYLIDGQDVLERITGMGTPTVTFKDGMATIIAMGETNTIAYTYENGNLTMGEYSVDVTGNTIQITEGRNSVTLTKK